VERRKRVGPPNGKPARRPFDGPPRRGPNAGSPKGGAAKGAPKPGIAQGQRRQPRVDLDDVIYGIHAVDEALAAGETLRRIHIGEDRKSDPGLRGLLDRARAAGVQVRFEQRGFFAAFPYKAHQGIVAYGEAFPYASLEEAIAAPRPGPALFVVLDHVTDPHNLGAIIRSAEAAGGTALIIPERRSAGVNATVRKASAGAVAHLPIVRVANVAQAVRTLKKARIWVVGAALGADARPYTDVDMTVDRALVVGAEGEGISPLVQRECDELVLIPMLGKTQSLNASVAAGVLLYEVVRQRRVARIPGWASAP
jgi:23S rRNA (guanosine2251-2'-O)-methyltransferase